MNDMFRSMCKTSKNIFNISLYCYKIFKIFEHDIYNELYNELKKNKNKDDYNNIFCKIYNEYHKKYTEKKESYEKLNKEIFLKLKGDLKNKIILNKNIDEYEKKYIKMFYDKDKYFSKFIVKKIIKSFYDKQFITTKNELLNHKPLTFKDNELISIVKNENYYYKENKINSKKNIANLGIKVKSEQNMIKYIVYNHHFGDNKNKLPADVIGNIIDKFYLLLLNNEENYYVTKKIELFHCI